jgi:hypothetical protein
MFRPSDLPQPGSGEYLQMLRDRMASFAHLPVAFVEGGPITLHDVSECGPDDLARALADLERLIGQAEAQIARVVHAVELRGVHRIDGHPRAHGWVRSMGSTSSGRARDIVSRSRLIGHNPWVGDALFDGRFTIAQVDVLARAWANPRVRDVFDDFRDVFLGFARDLPLKEFTLAVMHWVTLADADGADRERRDGEESRSLSFGLDANGRFSISGHAVGAQAIALNEILTKMVDAERLADWEQMRAEHGEAGTALDLPRTRSQRAMDALHGLALQAVESPPGSKAPVPVVNIVIDWHTLREWLDHVAERDPFGVPSLRRRLCHTIDGDPVDPAAVFAALVEGSVRVIGVDAARNPVAISTLQRGFTAAMRDTLRALSPTCVWPGCERRVSTTQTDHMDPWSNGGTTSTCNGTPLCDHHNRWRHANRYRVWKDPVGGVHTFRPDGTEVTAA